MPTNAFTDLTNTITGGANQNAQQDLTAILEQIQAIQTPTAQQLQLSPLAQYTSTGELNPALAQAAQAGPSAYNSENLSSVPMSTMAQALAQETGIANANGMTPQEQASIAQAEQSADENTAGQRGAIAQGFAGQGVPQSLIAAALENGTVGQNAQQEYQNALQAQGQAANQGLTALSNEGTLAGQMYGQQAGQANTVAAAQNALNQFNAANTQQTNLANQANTQAANTYDTTNAQSLANQNTLGSQDVQIQNQVEAPQEAANLALQKGQEISNIGNNQANQQTAAGQQAAGIFSGLLGAGAQVGSAAIKAADGGEIPPQQTVPPTAFRAGGGVPGMATVPGDSGQNDTVDAKLSPGEFVIPRTAMQNPKVRNFIAQNVPTPRPPSAHPGDISSVLKALSMLRTGAQA